MKFSLQFLILIYQQLLFILALQLFLLRFVYTVSFTAQHCLFLLVNMQIVMLIHISHI